MEKSATSVDAKEECTSATSDGGGGVGSTAKGRVPEENANIGPCIVTKLGASGF